MVMDFYSFLGGNLKKQIDRRDNIMRAMMGDIEKLSLVRQWYENAGLAAERGSHEPTYVMTGDFDRASHTRYQEQANSVQPLERTPLSEKQSSIHLKLFLCHRV
jgi:hypothetical protein